MALNETAAEVAALIPRFAWHLMDDDQRDDLCRDVILPRYMSDTSDGVALGPTWWAEQIGSTPTTIKFRVRRLKQKASVAATPEAIAKPSEAQKGAVRGAKHSIKKHPELAAKLVDPEVAAAIVADPEANRAISRARQEHDIDRQAVAEVKNPDRKQARQSTEQRDDFYELVRFRNWALQRSEVWRSWGWTEALTNEAIDVIEGLRAALDGLETAADFDRELQQLLQEK